jgi:hypothetical protein
MADLIYGEMIKSKYSREININKTYNIKDACEAITKDNMELSYSIGVTARKADGTMIISEYAHMNEAEFEELFQKMKQVRKARISLKRNLQFELEQKEKMEISK